ncbi:MAG: hypothetical protein GTN80_06080 [Nitrososphaeria archaeon]|nr:hypothetical protein [Nitrososphaeria archaeon]NIQ33193.1 hypothetical protein [Nitrososphaeria archaeon]
MSELSLRGIIPASILPMDHHHNIDEDSLRMYIQWLTKNRVAGIAVNVDTGEGPHLDREERIRVLQIYRDEIGGKVPIIAGMSAQFTAKAIELASDAKREGADALLVFPISAFAGEPLSPEVPYAYHKAIADAVDLPIILFQLQRDLGGVEFSEECLHRLIEIQEVVAIKEASFNAKRFVDTLRAVRSGPRRIIMLTGNDTFILESLILGADGALIGFGTLVTDQQIEMYEAVQRGDYKTAKEIDERIKPLIDVVFAPPVRNYRARIKEALAMLDVINVPHIRPPLTPVSKDEKKAIRKALKQLDLLK